jgi:hypothetical protein
MAAKTRPGPDPAYAKYLDKEPTELMEHITQWILDKTGADPTDMDSFEMGVHLTVALRPAHQASEENQERLEQNRLAAEQLAQEKAARRQERATKPKSGEEPETEEAPRRGRGRPRKTEAAETTEETPKRRPGRPRKAEAADGVVTPIARGRAGRRPPVEPEGAENEAPRTPSRRKPARRTAEAEF